MPETNPTDEYDSLSAEAVPGIDTQPQNGAPAAAELEKLKAQAADQRGLYLRSLADFDNYKKRIDRTIVERSDEGRRELLKRILPVLDSLQRAAEYRDQGTTAEKLVDGLLATVRQFTTALEAEQVRPIELKGQPFDPALAEAVGARYEPGVAENTVVDEARRGYMLGDEVLRPAQVIVSTSDS
ncbi:MAG: nucleotide exchange factor GrpE [Candidatus Eremiobacteraeota bacterium]|nr:nucleotide exchange factor GrpE [Candidatus Eremiobacteraeota bacterium]MBC5827966.1 nucleotide exchange factor GrpE [Candidatus Eremiobacteraeota bacterium]